MSEELLGYSDDTDEIEQMSLDEVDGLLISEYQDWPVNDRKPPYSAKYPDYEFAHENPAAWDYYWHPTVSKEAARMTLEADAALERAVPMAQRFNPYHDPHSGKFSTGHGGGGGAAVKERPRRQRITASEARGNSRPVSEAEFDAIAEEGDRRLGERMRNRKPLSHLDDERTWTNLKDDAYMEAQKSWGGVTINSHTGKPLQSDADMYALTIKKSGQETVSVPENVRPHEFHAAMDQAKERFRSQLEYDGAHLGVFHDDENKRIDIDPVLVVNSLDDVETIGAATHAIGGAYHFKSGDGFWPPHVSSHADLTDGRSIRKVRANEQVHWRGPGEWLSYADAVQAGSD